jgi:hypothetical protein
VRQSCSTYVAAIGFRLPSTGFLTMRVRSAGFAAVAATLTVAPAAVRAQEITTIGRYTVQGCADGIVRYAEEVGRPVNRPVFGRVACFGGFADLQLLVTSPPEGPQPFLRFAPAMTADFTPEFGGAGAFPVGADFSYRYATLGGGTLGGGTATLTPPGVSWTVGSPAPAAFTTFFEPVARDAILTSIGDVRGRLQIRYRLPGSTESTEFTQLSLTLTPVPEPATLVLAGAGLLALGAVARRRRA